MYKLLSIVKDGINSLAAIYEDFITKYGFNECKKLGNIKLKVIINQRFKKKKKIHIIINNNSFKI